MLATFRVGQQNTTNEIAHYDNMNRSNEKDLKSRKCEEAVYKGACRNAAMKTSLFLFDTHIQALSTSFSLCPL